MEKYIGGKLLWHIKVMSNLVLWWSEIVTCHFLTRYTEYLKSVKIPPFVLVLYCRKCLNAI